MCFSGGWGSCARNPSTEQASVNQKKLTKKGARERPERKGWWWGGRKLVGIWIYAANARWDENR